MNRKNTILIAVTINAGLLALLLLAAITSQDEMVVSEPVAQTVHPQFEEVELFEKSQMAMAPLPAFSTPILEIPVTEPVEPLVHKLPQPLASANEPAATPAVAVVVPSLPNALEVTVKKGDTLEKIAKAHKTTVSELAKINQLPSSFLKVGQVIKIPSEKSTAKPIKEKESAAEYYTMKVGENPWAIAMKHHMKVDELLKLNGLNEEKARKLKPGDRLRIR